MNLPCAKDTETWESFKKGDEKALTYIYTQNCDKLYLYGLRFTSNHALIEDSIQELFTGLIKNRKRLGDTDNILFYLLKSFKRKLYRKIKNEQRFKHGITFENLNFDVTLSVEHNIIYKEISERKLEILRRAVQKLTPRQKEAIYLRFTRELAYSETAELMEISIESCRNLISKAIATLKNSISEEHKSGD